MQPSTAGLPSPSDTSAIALPVDGNAGLHKDRIAQQLHTTNYQLARICTESTQASESGNAGPESEVGLNNAHGNFLGSPVRRTTVNVRHLTQSEDRMMSKLMAVVEKLQQELFDVERARKRAEGLAVLRKNDIVKLRGGLVEAERDGAWLDSETLRLQAELKSGLLRRDSVQDAIMHKQDEVSRVEQQLMEKAADIRGRKEHIAKLQDELKAAQAEPPPCAVAKSSIWSAALSDDEDELLHGTVGGAPFALGRRTVSLTAATSSLSSQDFGVSSKHRVQTSDGTVAVSAARQGSAQSQESSFARVQYAANNITAKPVQSMGESSVQETGGMAYMQSAAQRKS